MSKLWNRQQKDLTRFALILAVAVLCAIRLVLATQGQLYLEPENSPIDDQLMYNAAVSISNGQWLGAYAYNTIAKYMFFSVWLAFVHWTGLPYLVANAALGLAGAWVLASALRPVLKKRSWVLGAFFLLAYCPVGFDRYNYRIYRDSITVALLMLAFGGLIGAVLRALPLKTGSSSLRGPAQSPVPDPTKTASAPKSESGPTGKQTLSGWLYAAVGGLGLGASWLNREDGIWLLPFCLCFLVLGAVALLKTVGFKKSFTSLLSFCLPFVLLAGCLAAYAGMNLHYYGRFILSDFTSRDFTQAYGLLTGIEDENTGRRRPITKATRQLLYDNSDFFAELEPYWESGMVLGGYGSRDEGEYGGSFYYGLRLANQLAGHYTDAVETQHFYEQMTQELRRLEKEGILSIPHASASTIPYWRNDYLAPTLKEFGSSINMTLFCTNFDPNPSFSVFSKTELVADMQNYLNGEIVPPKVFAAGTDEPYHTLLQRAAFTFETVLCWAWRILVVPACLAGLWMAGAGCKKGFAFLFSRRALCQGQPVPCSYPVWVLLWGLGLSVLLRCAIMAYMEVTVFGIGTYLMYLSTAVPLAGLFGLLGVWTLFNRKNFN